MERWGGGVGGRPGVRVPQLCSAIVASLQIRHLVDLVRRDERSFAFFSLSRRGNATDVRLCDSV